jgi:L-cysteine desulfidase
MNVSDVLEAEWRPALGCTEPAAVAWAAALAARQAGGERPKSVKLQCDPRTYKNCYAVGIPKSGRRSGILMALGLGALSATPSLGLRVFEGNTEEIVAGALALIADKALSVEVLPGHPELMISVEVESDKGTGRAVIERDHGCLSRLEANGKLVGGSEAEGGAGQPVQIRERLAKLSFAERVEMARSISKPDRERLQEGIRFNVAIAERGMELLPKDFGAVEAPARLSRLVAAGVFARMSGEALPVMSLAGSGNKGITASVPIALWGRHEGHSVASIEEALALACIMTSAVTYQLGTLSAICGAANAAGIGIATALVLLEGGGEAQADLAINNMVGNLAGMICDGAKIGCAMKTMTGVDAAFRAAQLAMAGVGIPATDGILGADGKTSLANLGLLAKEGMKNVDEVVLQIMQEKLK